jgi:hypothetical protein
MIRAIAADPATAPAPASDSIPASHGYGVSSACFAQRFWATIDQPMLRSRRAINESSR